MRIFPNKVSNFDDNRVIVEFLKGISQSFYSEQLFITVLKKKGIG